MTILAPTNPKAKKVVTFDFTAQLALGETLSSPEVAVEVVSGTDSSAQGIINGSCSLTDSDTKVLVGIRNLKDRVTYRITVSAPTTNPLKQLALVGFITGDANA